jgi:sulfur relay (sulfurtransferase) DsrF/TusC family protein
MEANAFESATFETFLAGTKSPYLYNNDPIEHLMVMQHFSVSTRLLDWTFDPLVALFFACYDENNQFFQNDGNLLLIEKSQFHNLRVNNIENKIYKRLYSFPKENVLELLLKKVNNDKLEIFEPMIKNPRMRVQDGCFMFFPFCSFDNQNQKFVELYNYITKANKLVNEINDQAPEDKKIRKIWIGNKLIDKNYKLQILKELDNNYGISNETLFVEIEYLDSIKTYYSELKLKALEKSKWILNQWK